MEKKRQLTEIKGEGTLSAFAAIIDPLCAIAEDEETREMYMREHKPEQRGERSYLIQQAFKVLAKHQRDLAQVMSLCYDVTPEEYLAECTPGQALQDFAELIVSEVWKTFFTLPGRSGISSGSARENTAGPESSPPSAATLPREFAEHTRKRFTGIT